MAKRTKPPLNRIRRLKAMEASRPHKARDLNARALILSGKGGNHGDARKEQDRRVCRGRVDY